MFHMFFVGFWNRHQYLDDTVLVDTLYLQVNTVLQGDFLTILRQTIQMNDIYGVVHIVEAWAFIPKRPDDHTMKQILAGEIAVSDLKNGDKTEALVVRYECRDGSQRMWISPIVRPKTGGVALGDALEMGETAEGRFGNLF